jgi:DNA-directed RNA polymerase specialized sigma24 family protein
MGISHMVGSSAYDSDYDADELLERNDAYIVALARKKVPRNMIHPEMLSDEIDELAQKIRIKLWQASQKKKITSPMSYISCIAHSESVDMVRQRKFVLPLPVYEDGEIYQGNLMISPDEGVQDPAEKLEQEEVVIEWIARVVEGVLALPPCQLHAMVCSLKNQIDDILPLIEALRNRGVDTEEMNWPDGREEMQRLRASLSIARRKLRSLAG